ncbi:SDR family NAD(P)-dependent oxidoreductase [Terrilactibacillus sp. BCM23-1]|uniref:SDR family NAD(P)-dependent oxidoreductase n=1 Tax=Terrilactibacillus tamarindi TaxID=2599694 RepID=A0A6N8CM97_9BACI|nr:SDR family oxidoreductase [Terrilactibacillus tamarindi]MTT31142.1 SDR family NAD(P)-dependent oxidoreductase [Terrilactibacillus tamarindi]
MNKTVLITGATSGIGYEFVKLFSKKGYHLVLVARNQKKLEEIKQTFHGIDITIISKDLSKFGAAKEVYETVDKASIRIDVLINNAGFGLFGNFNELDIQKQSEMIQLNITALTELTHYFLPSLIENKGKILNVASTAAFQPGPLMAIYFATKAYVLSFSEALSEELSDHSVTVTVLCPGPTKTNFGQAANIEGSKLFSRPVDASKVAIKGYHALMSGKTVAITGGMNKIGALASTFLPRKLVAKMTKFILSK